jgi:hypothetical protein
MAVFRKNAKKVPKIHFFFLRVFRKNRPVNRRTKKTPIIKSLFIEIRGGIFEKCTPQHEIFENDRKFPPKSSKHVSSREKTRS